MTDHTSLGEVRFNAVFDRWEAKPPGKPQFVPLGAHTVTEHPDGTFTVSPSIVYSTPDRDDYWHGWCERSVWRSV